jgi:hypothetical protein
MLERNRNGKRNGSGAAAGVDLSTRFGPGGRDPSEAGRAGGRRSAEVRAALARLDPDTIARQLARNSSSPLAQRAALIYAVRRESESDRQRRLADEVVCELLDQKDDVEREIAQDRSRRDSLRAEVDELEERKLQLQQTIDAGEHELVMRLRSLDERGLLEHVLEQAGWLELIDAGETD